MSVRAPLVVPALKKHTATVIMAHGLGDRYVSSLSTISTLPVYGRLPRNMTDRLRIVVQDGTFFSRHLPGLNIRIW